MILPKENQRFLFISDALGPYEITIDRSLLEDHSHCRSVCKRSEFIIMASVGLQNYGGHILIRLISKGKYTV